MKVFSELYDGVREDFNRLCYDNATEAFDNIYAGLHKYGEETSPRGLSVREVLGTSIFIMNPADCIVYSDIRKMAPSYVCGEYLWYKSGSNLLEDIKRYSNFWDNIVNPDGRTVNSGYGYYIFNKGKHGVSEWDKLLEDFKKDPDTRQGVLQIPIMENKGTKDVPCTSSVQFLLRNGRLNMSVYMRSNDIWKGFVYDVFQFSMFQLQLAAELGVEVGWYNHNVGSLHLYETEYPENVGLESEYDDTVVDPIAASASYTDEFLHQVELCANKEYDKVEHEAFKLLISRV